MNKKLTWDVGQPCVSNSSDVSSPFGLSTEPTIAAHWKKKKKHWEHI